MTDALGTPMNQRCALIVGLAMAVVVVATVATVFVLRPDRSSGPTYRARVTYLEVCGDLAARGAGSALVDESCTTTTVSPESSGG